MKKEDAVPGTLVRVPDHEGVNRARQAMLNGGHSLAGVILAYGRYHREVQGLCGEAIIVERKFADNSVVVLVQKPIPWAELRSSSRPDRMQARTEIGPTTDWTIQLYSLQSVMNHDAWVAAGESKRLLNMEVQALNERQDALRKEAFDLARSFVKFDELTVPSWQFYTNTVSGKLGITISASQEDPAAFMPEAPQEVLDRLAAIEAEQKSILAKLSCVR